MIVDILIPVMAMGVAVLLLSFVRRFDGAEARVVARRNRRRR